MRWTSNNRCELWRVSRLIRTTYSEHDTARHYFRYLKAMVASVFLVVLSGSHACYQFDCGSIAQALLSTNLHWPLAHTALNSTFIQIFRTGCEHNGCLLRYSTPSARIRSSLGTATSLKKESTRVYHNHDCHALEMTDNCWILDSRLRSPLWRHHS